MHDGLPGVETTFQGSKSAVYRLGHNVLSAVVEMCMTESEKNLYFNFSSGWRA